MKIYSRLPSRKMDFFSDAHSQRSGGSMLAVPVDRGSAQAWGGPCQTVPTEVTGAQGSILLVKEFPVLQHSWAHESDH